MTLTIHTFKVTSILRSFLLALSYGVYISTSILCLQWLYSDGDRSGRGGGKKFMLIVSVVLFLLETAGLATYFKATLLAQNLDRRGYNIFNTIYNSIGAPIYQIADAVQIYRCWVVYGYAWRIICLPILLWISSVALSVYAVRLCLLGLNGETDRSLSRVSQTWSEFFACSIVISVYATTAIVYRIVSVTRHSINRTGRLRQTWRIVAESGALHTLSGILILIANALFSQNVSSKRYATFQGVADAMHNSIAGIAFNLILIRVYDQHRQGAAGEDKTSNSQFINTNMGQLSTIQFRSAEMTDLTRPHTPLVSHSNTDNKLVL
ncbi:hypothetical protein AX15_006637 [Amanita polypyramis BW_CC]|nr:hypothetical protein AX15_006637 [Amanita polypyramis BW_CC]